MTHPNVIALIANRAFIPAAYATAASILAQGLRDDTTIAILQPPGALEPEDRAWFENSLPRVEHVEIEPEKYLPREIADWDSVVTCQLLRLALAEIFSSARKVLYVDADILAFQRVDIAFDFDLRNKLVAAAHNNLTMNFIGAKKTFVAYRNALGVPMGMPYLNGGVLLLDAGVWRETGAKRMLLDLFLANRALCRHLDQSVLNLHLKGDFAPLSPAWNFQQTYQAIGAEDMVRPRFVHFAGTAKPWRSNGFVFRRTYRMRYRELLLASPFVAFFEPYWRFDRKQSKEAWRSVKYAFAGREIQSGIKRTDIPRLREGMRDLLKRSDFIDRADSAKAAFP